MLVVCCSGMAYSRPPIRRSCFVGSNVLRGVSLSFFVVATRARPSPTIEARTGLPNPPLHRNPIAGPAPSGAMSTDPWPGPFSSQGGPGGDTTPVHAALADGGGGDRGAALGIHLALRRRATSFGARSTALREQWNSIFLIRAEAGDTPARRRLLSHIADLQMKHERAARRPWLPVDPDPPRPD